MKLTQDILRKHMAGASNDDTTKGVIVGDKNNANSKTGGNCC